MEPPSPSQKEGRRDSMRGRAACFGGEPEPPKPCPPGMAWLGASAFFRNTQEPPGSVPCGGGRSDAARHVYETYCLNASGSAVPSIEPLLSSDPKSSPNIPRPIFCPRRFPVCLVVWGVALLCISSIRPNKPVGQTGDASAAKVFQSGKLIADVVPKPQMGWGAVAAFAPK